MTQSDRHLHRRIIPVYVLLPPYTLLMDVAGPVEVLRRANIEQDDVLFDYQFIAAQPSQTTSVGLTLADLKPLPDHIPDGAYVILSGSVTPPDDAEDIEPELATLATWLNGAIRPGITLVTICSGAVLAARAGLMDGYACTTHAACLDEVREFAPTARVLDNRLYVEDRDRYSSAGITTGTDLMLHLASKLTSPMTALTIARHMVVYMRRTGAEPQLSPWLSGRNHVHPAIHRVQDAIMADPAHGWSLAELTGIGAMSARHISRLFQEHAGLSVTAYVNLMRVTLARDVLANSRLDMERVAEKSGFASPRHMRRVWSKYNALPPSHYRRSTAE
ncbi:MULTISPECIES: helix-turn-helix domain-containing protein [unclassified Rhizobium]|uniref:GlxA family transcriptional regulator n=1 Tax=unclassified Rhizobium TaxID=2613769 RepID=UPI000DDC37A9|nr:MULTISPECIES: helix-turn-helix domain-containing protein [unclassified Rhizobium]MBB3287294.1 transcriptional regulator GlxA family with amidase domain [Rhizobium sp. BK252]MBB3402034.1 transcriptional regulator GlxA family with amidase domain [Rhizobium sp. BK289]MBB3414611.1 transcriptional regulator GlxA family with amidase domain [Rhizobium sp. BK284]MBB3482500.1 transcriptional regulator GlxA family with amidase domain [Rhizobium sp. BK347]MDK4721293.1 helix-turn-helix domain-containin